jgi:hypothetical protein
VAHEEVTGRIDPVEMLFCLLLRAVAILELFQYEAEVALSDQDAVMG